MKAFLISLTFTISIFTCFFIQSCIDPCKGISCQNGATCRDGICDCPNGFSGIYCEVNDLAKLAGTYFNYQMFCGGGASTFGSLEIVLDNSSSSTGKLKGIIPDEFQPNGSPSEVTFSYVNDKKKLVITNQKPYTNANYNIDGELFVTLGSFGISINGTINKNYATFTQNCSGSCFK
jgi:hypothetical protein